VNILIRFHPGCDHRHGLVQTYLKIFRVHCWTRKKTIQKFTCFFLKIQWAQWCPWTDRGQPVERPILAVERPILAVERPTWGMDTPPKKNIICGHFNSETYYVLLLTSAWFQFLDRSNWQSSNFPWWTWRSPDANDSIWSARAWVAQSQVDQQDVGYHFITSQSHSSIADIDQYPS
jgi:hypothetical protein